MRNFENDAERRSTCGRDLSSVIVSELWARGSDSEQIEVANRQV